MSIEAHKTCPHCKALVQSTICTICGRSAFEEVAAPIVREREKWWTTLENGEIRKVATTVVVALAIAGVVAFILTRPEAEVTATELPPPDPNAVDIADPEPKAPDAPPAADAVTRPNDLVTPGAPREVSEGLSPWETLPPIDFVTGEFLDEDIDYGADIDRVDELLLFFPASLEIAPLDPPEILTFDGSLDVEMLETTQPFAARTVTRDDGLEVGELWLIASSGSDVGDAYLASARERWDIAAAVDSYAPAAGVRLWQLGSGDGLTLWATDLEQDSMLVIQAPSLLSPEIVTDTLRAWRRAIAAE
ncbi:MAG: hypothetical protein DHS20C19_08330 [Acidimicrobiales bacterium]|nr:MAG: hypothetical protein DHS20C19_08330 [Acidimicrobiales bacterium]